MFKPFLLRLFGAFVLLAGIPVVGTNIINQVMVTRLYTEELGDSYQEKLRIGETILTLWEDEIVKHALAISMSEYLNSLEIKAMSPGTVPDYEYINGIKRLSSFLENIVSTNNKFHSIAVYYDNTEFQVSSVYGLTVDESGYTYADYAAICAEGSRWLPRQIPVLGGDSEEELLYIIPFMRYVTTRKGVMIFHVKEAELSAVINGGMGRSSSGVFILDYAGNVISDTNKQNLGKNLSESPPVKAILESSSESGFFSAAIDGSRHFIAYRYSVPNGWYYCSFVPANELSWRTRIIFMITIFVTFGFLLLTVSLSYYSAKRLNLPVEKLEYRLEDLYLVEKLTGIKDKDPPPGYRQLFPYENFCAVLLCVDYYTELIQSRGADKIDECKAKILELCRDSLDSSIHCSGLFMEQDSLVLILNFSGSDISFLPAVFQGIQKEVISIFGFTLSIGIGTICGENEIPQSYNSARRAVSSRLINGPGGIFRYRQEAAVAKGYFYPYEKEKILINHLRLHSRESSSVDVENFFNAIRNEDTISVDNVIQICNQLLGEIIKYFFVLGISSREIYNDENNLYIRLSRFEFLDEIESFFRELLEKIIRFELLENASQEAPINRIMNYIRNNYDKPFDLNTLSDKVGLSYSHVRRIFTNETGEGILNYVYKMKVEFAKKLLLETVTPVNEIALKLGFYNRQSFYRFFKKFEGITPNKYREIKV